MIIAKFLFLYLRDVHQDDTCAELFNKLGKQDMF